MKIKQKRVHSDRKVAPRKSLQCHLLKCFEEVLNYNQKDGFPLSIEGASGHGITLGLSLK